MRAFSNKVGKPRNALADLHFERGRLHVVAHEALVSVAAKGWWPLDVVVPAAFAQQLKKVELGQDPVLVTVEGGELSVDALTFPCECLSAKEGRRRCRTPQTRPVPTPGFRGHS